MLLPKLSAHYASSRARSRSSFKCLNMFDPIPHNVEQTQQCHQNKSMYLPFERIGLCQCWTYLVVSLKHDPYTFCNKRTLQSTILIFTTFRFGREHIATKKTEQRSWIAEYPETRIKPPAKDTKQPKQKSDNFGQYWATDNELQLVFASLSCLLLAWLESRLAELVPPLPCEFVPTVSTAFRRVQNPPHKDLGLQDGLHPVRLPVCIEWGRYTNPTSKLQRPRKFNEKLIFELEGSIQWSMRTCRVRVACCKMKCATLFAALFKYLSVWIAGPAPKPGPKPQVELQVISQLGPGNKVP